MKRFIATLTVFALLTLSLLYGDVIQQKMQAEEKIIDAAFGDKVVNEATLSDSTNTLQLTVNATTGTLRIQDLRTGKLWLSNLEKLEDELIATGVSQTRVVSQLLITYKGDSIDLFDTNLEQNKETGKTAFSLYKSKDTITAVYDFIDLGFSIPLQYKLGDRKLIATVPAHRIKETKANNLLSFSILPFLGAAGQKDEGYILIPDGSGALINFNNGKTGEDKLTIDALYGDRSKPSVLRQVQTQPVLIPALGFNYLTPKTSLLAYVTKGAVGGKIVTNVAGRETSLNYAYYTFLYHSYDTVVFMDRTGYAKPKIMIDNQGIGTDTYEIQYSFIDSENSGLGGMAKICRDYIFGDRKPTSLKSLPLFVDVYMGLRARTNFLGIPYYKLLPLTTFSQAQTMADTFKNKGIKDLNFRLMGIDSDGMFGDRIDTSIMVSDVLGGMRGLQDLQNKEGLDVYPQMDIVTFNRSGNGIWDFKDSAYDIKKNMIKQSIFTVASGVATEIPPMKLIKSFKIPSIASSIAKSLDKNGIHGIAVPGLGFASYTDFSNANPTRLQQTSDNFSKAMDIISKSRKTMLEAPIDTMLSKAEVLQHIPTQSSHYNLEDTDVPFLPMLLSGYIIYAGDDINLCGDMEQGLLRAIESNSALSSALIWTDYTKQASIVANKLYASVFSEQKEQLLDLYNKQKAALDGVYGLVISDVTVLDAKARAITYENGYIIIVNYNDKEIEWQGVKIPRMGYFVQKGVKPYEKIK